MSIELDYTVKIFLEEFTSKIDLNPPQILIEWFSSIMHINTKGKLKLNHGNTPALPFNLLVNIYGTSKYFKSKTVLTKSFLKLISIQFTDIIRHKILCKSCRKKRPRNWTARRKRPRPIDPPGVTYGQFSLFY